MVDSGELVDPLRYQGLFSQGLEQWVIASADASPQLQSLGLRLPEDPAGSLSQQGAELASAPTAALLEPSVSSPAAREIQGAALRGCPPWSGMASPAACRPCGCIPFLTLGSFLGFLFLWSWE